ncbi:MAG: pseudoazurin [Methylobacterium sp.]|uniref:pseudoazurin n=1 Tax=unclassified Methylobacterium TaxID=2615210 RepID=UPI0006FBFA02|nr:MULTISPECIES: pseudoazurin [unclassified Methylobacterium]KQP07307.1 pseudoazurin [Methylobacterium sp. Leaf99]MDO9427488.1 pseudoazurin [Methylobacterium sp.]TXM78901.1 pseudoazurin [Methylobacterium sp. WL69]
MTKLSLLAGTVALCAVIGTTATAAEVTVKTLNSGADGMMVFEPAFVKLAPGDSIKFAPTDKGHNAELIKGMAPEGAATFKTVVGKEEVVTFDKPGVYGIKCSPHYIMGMIGLVVVGDKPANLEAAKAVPHGKIATKRFEPLFAQVQ